eukprot:5516680-Alexandrium_andersonii.AAC.1
MQRSAGTAESRKDSLGLAYTCIPRATAYYGAASTAGTRKDLRELQGTAEICRSCGESRRLTKTCAHLRITACYRALPRITARKSVLLRTTAYYRRLPRTTAHDH